jgi:uncharacterized membrane protein
MVDIVPQDARDTGANAPVRGGGHVTVGPRPIRVGGADRRKDAMNPRVRLLIILVVVAIVLYFVIAQPDNAAALVRNVLAAIGQAVEQIIRFFRQLTA